MRWRLSGGHTAEIQSGVLVPEILAGVIPEILAGCQKEDRSDARPDVGCF